MIKKVGTKWCLFTKDGSRKLGCHPSKAEAEAQERVIEEKMKDAVQRTITTFRGATGQFRLDTLEGREHVVVPVVALVEGVLFAANASTPELVTAEAFGKVPQGWNGRPVVLHHPEVYGAKVSANEPGVLERYRIGQVFHAHVENQKLVMEAWIDPARVNALGDEATQFLEGLRAGQVAEVSVGAFVQTENRAGEYNGKRYDGVWQEIVPDHLAMLPGEIGACSVDMGCGAPRAAATNKEAVMTLRERFLALVAKFTGAQEGLGDSDVRGALDRALFAVEPGYLGIAEVYQEDKKVVYAVAPDGEQRFLERTFELGDDGTVSLGKDASEVRMVTKFEPMTAAAGSPCGCGSPKTSAGKEEVEMDRKARVAALIASGKTCFTAAAQAVLEQLPEDELKKLEEHVAQAQEPTPEPEPAPAQAPEPQPTPAPEPTEEEKTAAFLSGHPEIKTILDNHRAAEAAKKTELITALKAAQSAYSEAELSAMSLEQLEKLTRVASVKVKDFGPVGTLPRAPEGERPQSSDELRAAMDARIKDQRKKPA